MNMKRSAKQQFFPLMRFKLLITVAVPSEQSAAASETLWAKLRNLWTDGFYLRNYMYTLKAKVSSWKVLRENRPGYG